jgi:hypothetical protein
MRGLLEWFADIARWCVAVILGIAPRRFWHRLEPPLPLAATAVPAGLFTFVLGFIIGVPGFFTYAEAAADTNNTWMLQNISRVAPKDANYLTTGPVAISLLTLFAFLFLTPLGLLTTYLITTGALRAVSAMVDDPRGDPFLSAVHWATTSLMALMKRASKQHARERLEGPDVPDRMVTGEAAGLTADYVVIASRRKPEWEAGAIILTSTDWYRLGAPIDAETENGLRTLYPLTKLDAVEVVRRGIQYELPRLSTRRSTRNVP